MIVIKCKRCTNNFRVLPSRENKAKYCSYKCYWKSLIGKEPPRTAFKKGQPKTENWYKIMKGRASWNKGLRGWHSGKENSFYGKKHTEEAKRKNREAHLGKVTWMKGKHHTKEARKKNSESHKGKFIGKNHPMYGKKHTEETLIKIAQARLKQSYSKEPTSIEKKVYQELKNRSLLFEKQKLINGKFLVDAFIPSLNLIIEADGDYWHSLPEVVKRDKSRNAYLLKCGFNLLRLSETEINKDIKSCMDKIN